MSSAANGHSSNFNQQIIRNHIDWLNALPRPPETFVAMDDVPAAHRGDLAALKRTEAIEQVRREPYPGESDGTKQRYVYRLSDRAVAILDELLAERETPCPCGHGGLRNCGEYYACGYAPCDREFERADIDEEAL